MTPFRLPVLILAATLVSSGPLAAETLEVQVRGVRSAQGAVRADVYAPGRRHVATQVVPAAKGATALRFEGLAPGEYAVMFYHDENADGRMGRKGPLGMPSEGYAFTRDAPVRLGPPSFERMRVTVPAGGSSAATVTMRYP